MKFGPHLRESPISCHSGSDIVLHKTNTKQDSTMNCNPFQP